MDFAKYFFVTGFFAVILLIIFFTTPVKESEYNQNDIRVDNYKREIEALRLSHEEDSLAIVFFTHRVTDAETQLEKFKKKHNEKINRIDSLSGDELYNFLSNASR